jgi:hypothetical protein
MKATQVSSIPNMYAKKEWFGLIQLLGKSDKKSEVWQNETGRLTALAHLNSMSKDVGDEEYLLSLALCRWAQILGVHEAKKKTIAPQRFRNTNAPNLSNFSDPGMLFYILEVLSSVRSNWCFEYISEVSKNSNLDKQSVAILGKWISKNRATCNEIIQVLAVSALSSDLNSTAQLLRVNQAITLCKSVVWETPQASSIDFASSILTLSELIKKQEDDKKLTSALWTLLETLQKRVVEIQPLAVLESNFVLAVDDLFATLVGTQYKKPLSVFQSKLSEFTIACLVGLIQRGGAQEVHKLKGLISIFKRIYPNFSKRIKELSLIEPDLVGFFEDSKIGHTEILEDRAASVYARLLPDWNSFLTNSEHSAELEVLNSNLLEAASLNGVEWLGQVGEECVYDPILYQINTGATPNGKLVKIIRPTIIYKRAGHSYRVVLRGLVELS